MHFNRLIVGPKSKVPILGLLPKKSCAKMSQQNAPVKLGRDFMVSQIRNDASEDIQNIALLAERSIMYSQMSNV
jgi:hypothetical protein